MATTNLGIRTTNSIFAGSKTPVDTKKAVGPTCKISDIEYLVDNLSDFILPGHLVDDFNFGITWQIYTKDDGSYGYRPYDGMIHVKTVVDATGGIDDGVSTTYGDKILLFSSVPQFNGIYEISSSAVGYPTNSWRRLTIFDETSDSLANVLIKVDEGTRWKDSLWTYTSYGDNFVQTELSDLVSYSDYSDYSDLGGYYWGVNYGKEFHNLLSTVVTDSWHTFETVGGSYPPIYATDSMQMAYTTPFIWAEPTTGGVEVNYFTRLIPNKQYIVTKLSDSSDTSDNYATLASDALTDTFPDVLLTKNGDTGLVTLNQTNGTSDYSYVFSGGRELWKFSAGIYTSDDNSLTDTIPAGWNIFAIKGTCSDAEYIFYSFGTTSDASDIIPYSDIGGASSDADCKVVFGGMTTNWTTDTTIYFSDINNWANATSVEFELCLYKDTRG